MKSIVLYLIALMISVSVTLASEGAEKEAKSSILAKANDSQKVIFENAEEQKANSVMLFDSKGNLIKAEKYEAPTKLDSIEIKIDKRKETLLSAYIEFDTGATKMLKVKMSN